MATSNLRTVLILVLSLGLKSFSQTPSPQTHGQWGSKIEFDLVPVAIANLPDGRLVTWSSKYHDDFDMNDGYTFTQIFDPLGNEGLGAVLPRAVTETFHDMFCPGINNLADGRLLVTGGSSDEKTSIYDPKTGIWTAAEDMNIARGYQGAVTLADGSAFTIGGSWNDGVPAGGRDGEIWREGVGWTHLPGLPGSMLYNGNDIAGEPEGVYRLDNHAWLWAAPNGKILHAGPGEEMHWIDVNGNGGTGSYQLIGKRGDDYMSMNGNTAMFDIGKILKVGGSASYSSNTPGNSNAYVIELDTNGGDNVTVTKVSSPEHARIYVSSVVLPHGEVLILGGRDEAEVFVDRGAYLSAEMFNPATNSFRTLASMEVPRTYHSAAILLKDGRVFMGGGGLCGENCAENHKDAEIFSPPYLFNASGELAERPTLSAPDKAFFEKPLTVVATSGVQEFSFIRMSSATHSINNEQRRVPVGFTENNGVYVLDIPEANLMPPGYYMLFAIKDDVPSIAETVMVEEPDSRISGDNLLVEFDFFEGNGDLIRDTSGNENHGLIKEFDNNGTPVDPPSNFWTADGLSGSALEMDGMEFNSNSIVEIPTSPSLATLTDQITVMAWVNRTRGSMLPNGDIPNVAIFTHVGNLTPGINEYSSFFFGYHADQYKLEFFTEGGGSAVIYHEDKKYTPGVWEHLVGTYDGTTASLYVNGELLDSKSVTGNLKINTENFPNNVFTLSGFYEMRPKPIVSHGNRSGITDELDGRMDKFKLYNIALSKGEIEAIYNEEIKTELEEDPCDEFYLVYEIGDNIGSGSNEISIREGNTIKLSLNDQNVDYIVRDPNGVEIPHGIIENITESGEYTISTIITTSTQARDLSVSVCSEELGQISQKFNGTKAVDGNPGSYWHTLWTGDQDPNAAPEIGPHYHYIDLDLGENSNAIISELTYLPRQRNDRYDGNGDEFKGRFSKYNIYISSSLGDLGDPGTLVATGDWEKQDNNEQTVIFDGEIPGRYVRLESATDGETWAAVAEIGIIAINRIECVKTLEINVVTPKTYTFDGSWSSLGDPSGVSNEFDDIIIESGDAVISESTSCHTITVAPGASLTIDPSTSLNITVKNSTTLNSTSTSFSSLIENGYFKGDVYYNRYVNEVGTTTGGGNDLISPPVESVFDIDFVTTNEGVLAKHPTTEGIYAFGPYNVSTDEYENFDIGLDNSGSFPLVHGSGYRVATVTGGGTLTFKGKTTKNPVSIAIADEAVSRAWNLIGNPYPSYIDVEEFFTLNNIDQLHDDYIAVYGYKGSKDSWEIYNLATSDTLIAPGQGFFVKAKSGGGLIQFTPSMRRTGSSDDFIPGRQANTTKALSKLKLSSASNNVLTSIYFIEGATRGLDRGYDAATYSATAVDFSIFTNLLEDHTGRDIAIQSLPYEDFNDVIVPLGIKAKAGTELSISIDEVSTLPPNINVYLEDIQENAFVLLNNGAYTFRPSIDMNGTDRFNVHYSSRTLSAEDIQSNDNLRIYTTTIPKTLVIAGQLRSATIANMYDVQGRLVLSKALNSNSTENTMDISTIGTGVYIVKVANDSQVKTQKIVIK